MKKVKEALYYITYGFCMVMTVWLVASFFDANANNTGDGQVSDWNCYQVLVHMSEKGE